MSSVRKLWIVLASLMFSLAAPLAAHAQLTNCASFPTPIVINGTVDPFGATNAINTSFSYTVTDPDSNAIDVVFLFLPTSGQPNTALASQATMQGSGANPGDNAFSPMVVSTPPTINVDSVNGEKLNYNGSGHSDTATIKIQVPGGLNLTAGQNDFFYDIYFACKGSGGLKTSTMVVSKGLDIRFSVAAELQASFAGTSLPLGDVTNDLTGQAAITGQINVKSSTSYQVSVSSPNGFLLEPGGTGATGPSQEIGYKLTYLGQTASGVAGGVSSTWTSQHCLTASVAGVSQAITATLNENVKGASPGKVAGSYKDTVTVTFTPDVTPTTGLAACSS